MNNTIIIHYAPIELYPPVQNLLHEIARNRCRENVVIISTRTSESSLSIFNAPSDKITIIRLGLSGQKLSPLRRYLNYLYFYIAALLCLAWLRPLRILYYETLSSFPVYLYKRFLGRNTDVLIHYHEYTSPEEYQSGMVLANYFHRLEKWLYPKAVWISHTNEFRMAKFKEDIYPVQILQAYILPNHPSRSWFVPAKPALSFPLKVVYAGALSMQSMYTQKFAAWVMSQNGNVYWDIYSYNCTPDARDYLRELNSDWIRLKPGVNYHELPGVLRQYDVGVILYNGHIPNYIYNAPNKLFEYMVSGLGVWFPVIMAGSLPFRTENVYPEAIPLDFNNLEDFSQEMKMDRRAFSRKDPVFFCEDALTEILKKLKCNDQ